MSLADGAKLEQVIEPRVAGEMDNESLRDPGVQSLSEHFDCFSLGSSLFGVIVALGSRDGYEADSSGSWIGQSCAAVWR